MFPKKDDCKEVKSAKIMGLMGILAAILSASIAGGFHFIQTQENNKMDANIQTEVGVNIEGNNEQPVVAVGNAAGDVNVDFSSITSNGDLYRLNEQHDFSALGKSLKYSVFSNEANAMKGVKCNWIFSDNTDFVVIPDAGSEDSVCDVSIKASAVPIYEHVGDEKIFASDVSLPLIVQVLKDDKVLHQFKTTIMHMNFMQPYLKASGNEISLANKLVYNVYATPRLAEIPDEVTCIWGDLNDTKHFTIENLSSNGCKVSVSINKEAYIESVKADGNSTRWIPKEFTPFTSISHNGNDLGAPMVNNKVSVDTSFLKELGFSDSTAP